MLERYAREEMKQLWSESTKYLVWAAVERAHLEEQVKQGQASKEVLVLFDQALQSKTVADYLRREKETGHDVIAFVAEVGDAMGDKSPFLHKGLTSSDILDTSMALRITQSLDLLLDGLFQVRLAFADRAFEHAETICIGRTHGIHAEPMSFGQVLAGYFAEFQRAHAKLLMAKQVISTGKLSGAVGTYSQMSPTMEQHILQSLGLEPECVATQVLPRDKLVVVADAVLACALATERFAVNFRHWARTELGEVLEPFGEKQKGSSAMPHKKNPILAENLTGLSHAIRGYSRMISENTALWHERDISHSSVERFALPDMFVTCDFMLSRLAYLVQKMEVNLLAMKKNLEHTGGLWASSSVLTALVTSGMNRTEAYELIQKLALQISPKVSVGEVQKDEFLNALLSNEKILNMAGESTLKSAFELKKYLASVPVVFQRTFGIVPEEYVRKTKERIQNKVPALHKVWKVTVRLLPDVLDTEAKAIGIDMENSAIPHLGVCQERSFLIRQVQEESKDLILNYAREVLYNSVMEQFHLEQIQ